MAPKRPNDVTSSIFDEDDASLLEMSKKHAPRDDCLKKRKVAHSQMEKAKGSGQEGCEKEAAMVKPSETWGPKRGKSRFYHEAARLTPSLAKGLILSHVPLIMGAKDRDYGEPRFYSRLSSLGKTDPAREESYRITRSLGAALEANLACGYNFRQLGILPGENSDAAKFAELYQKALVAPEMERDLFQVEDSALVEAASFHLVSVSGFFPLCTLFALCLLYAD